MADTIFHLITSYDVRFCHYVRHYTTEAFF